MTVYDHFNRRQRGWSQIFCDCFYVMMTVYDDFNMRQIGWSQIFCNCFVWWWQFMIILTWGREAELSFLWQFGLGVKPDDDNARVPVMTWNTCAFTIMSFGQNTFLFGLFVVCLSVCVCHCCLSVCLSVSVTVWVCVCVWESVCVSVSVCQCVGLCLLCERERECVFLCLCVCDFINFVCAGRS